MNPRFVAYEVLCALEGGRSNSSLLLQRHLAGIDNPADRHLVTDLVLGVLRRRARLLFLIGSFSRKRVEQLDLEIAVILQLGVYQLVYSSIPQHAAVNETVALCGKARKRSAASFVNGILRSLQSRLSDLPEPPGDLVQKLSVEGSHPAWLVSRWLARFGETETRALLDINNLPPRVYARINTLVADREAVVARLAKENVRVAATEFGADVLSVEEGAPQLTGSFADGEFYIQDAGIELLCSVIDPRAGESVLELAAAPGGKTFQLALRADDRGLIIASDADKARMRIWQANIARLHIRSAHGVVADARKLPVTRQFDRVLVDAPCSSLGVVRRHPEIKWRRPLGDLQALQEAQLQILQACAKYVGGELFYLVCSFEEEETRIVTDRFLASTADFERTRELTLLPQRDHTDGFYMAAFRRRRS